MGLAEGSPLGGPSSRVGHVRRLRSRRGGTIAVRMLGTRTRRIRQARSLARPSLLARAAAPLCALAALALLERAFPRRVRTEPTGPRARRNLAFACLGVVTNLALNRLLVLPVARVSVQRRFGLLQWLRLPFAVETLLGVAWLDYTLYLWHDLSHRVGVLWRLHVVHHADRDMDVTTGLRFHFAELAASLPLRALLVGAFGVSPRAVDLWQSAIVVSSLFHHANLRLPARVERWLSLVLVTPHMHEIHHSEAAADRNANFSSGIALWDSLHGTRKDAPSEAVVIGLPASIQGDESTLRAMLVRPFAGAASTAE